MIDILLEIAKVADGVRFPYSQVNFPYFLFRCDMAMLLLSEIFNKTWEHGITSHKGVTQDDTQFWAHAIKKVKSKYPNFLFIAEVT